jgi:AcrR family transcriptional regulator
LARGRPPKDRRQEILEAASDLVIEHGYGGTSLDAIVERAGCSKSSIYKYFGNKQGLISALAVDLVQDLSHQLALLSRADLTVEQALLAYAKRALTLILTDRHMALVRLIIAEVWRHPSLGHAYYSHGPLAAHERLAEYLAEQAGAGNLEITDPVRAAVQFYGLMLWDKWNAQAVGAKKPMTKKEVEEEAEIAVASFLRLYRGKGAEESAGNWSTA